MKKLLIIILSVFVFISCGEVDPVDKWKKDIGYKIYVELNNYGLIFFLKDTFFALSIEEFGESRKNEHKFKSYALDALKSYQKILSDADVFKNSASYLSLDELYIVSKEGSFLTIETFEDNSNKFYLLDTDSLDIIKNNIIGDEDYGEFINIISLGLDEMKVLLKEIEKEWEKYKKDYLATNNYTNK